MLSDDQIIDMADQAGLKIDPRFGECYTGNVQLIAFARLIQQAQRDEDARICESTVWAEDISAYREMTKRDIAVRSMIECAAAIRKGGMK
jgi:hypothetical protein